MSASMRAKHYGPPSEIARLLDDLGIFSRHSPSGRPVWISAGRESMSARRLATSGPWSAIFMMDPI
jgi:hypothetical protein